MGNPIQSPIADESHLPFSQQSLVFRLFKRAEIRRASTERKSVQEGRPDRVADLLEESANRIRALDEALRQCVGLLEAMRGDFVEPYFNARLKALTQSRAALGDNPSNALPE